MRKIWMFTALGVTATALAVTGVVVSSAAPAPPYGCAQVTQQLKVFAVTAGEYVSAGNVIGEMTLLDGMTAELRDDAASPGVSRPLAAQETALAGDMQQVSGTSYRQPIAAIARMCKS